MRKNVQQFLAATKDCVGHQQKTLRELIALNADSQFGRDHHFGEILTSSDFKKNLPVSNFENVRPYIEKLKQGEFQALLGPNNPLLMFTLSSGTTSESKFIPITKRFLDDYRRGWQIWAIRAYDRHPDLNFRQIVQFSSDHEKFFTPGKTPCGNISGLVAAMQKRLVRMLYSIPLAVSKIHNPQAKLYTAIRFALADKNVGMIMTANPSTLIQVAELAAQEQENLIRDIADGTLSSLNELGEVPQRLLGRKLFAKDRRRAQELEKIVQQTGSLAPSKFWPRLNLLAVWTGGSVGFYLPTLRRYYGKIPIRDHGLSASEGRMTIPLEDEEADGVLDLTTHYFEFIPEEEYGSQDPIVLEAHELEVDKNYYILLTTSSGLYRYDICDVVRCTRFYGSTPMLQFLHKGAHISNITGEKITESQVVNAVSQVLDSLSLELSHFTLCPIWGNPPRYQLLAEERQLHQKDQQELFVKGLDQELQNINCEYQEKRSSGRLAPIQWVTLPSGTWDQLIAERQKGLGGSLEQYKHTCLVSDLNFSQKLV